MLLHNPNFKPKSNVPESSEVDPPANEKSSSDTSAVTCSQISNGVYLCVVPVCVKYGEHETMTYAFLDQGSSQSFCDQKLIKALQISGSQQDITLQTLTDRACTYQEITCSLSVRSLSGSHCIKLNKVISIADIPVKPNAIPAKRQLNALSHLKDIPFATVQGATVTLLIGADAPEVFCPLNVRKGGRGEPIALETLLGWTLLGPSLSPSVTSKGSVNFVQTREDALRRDIEQLRSTDFADDTSVLNQP